MALLSSHAGCGINGERLLEFGQCLFVESLLSQVKTRAHMSLSGHKAHPTLGQRKAAITRRLLAGQTVQLQRLVEIARRLSRHAPAIKAPCLARGCLGRVYSR